MALATRLLRLFTADAHAMLDRLEEPDILFDQSVREMRDVIDEIGVKRRRICSRLAELDDVELELQREHETLNAELDAVLAADDEALAQHLVARLIRQERHAQVVQAERVDLTREDGELEAAELRCQSQLRDLETKRRSVARARTPMAEESGVSPEDVCRAPPADQAKERCSVKPNFAEGVFVALLGATLIAASDALFVPVGVLGLATIFTLSVVAYCLYLLTRARERSGRVIYAAALVAVAGVVLALDRSVLDLCFAFGAIWITRAVFFSHRLPTLFADAALGAAALMVAAWAAPGGGIWLSAWSFFLLHGCYVFLEREAAADSPDLEQRFEKAHAAAERAFVSLIKF